MEPHVFQGRSYRSGRSGSCRTNVRAHTLIFHNSIWLDLSVKPRTKQSAWNNKQGNGKANMYCPRNCLNTIWRTKSENFSVLYQSRPYYRSALKPGHLNVTPKCDPEPGDPGQAEVKLGRIPPNLRSGTLTWDPPPLIWDPIYRLMEIQHLNVGLHRH